MARARRQSPSHFEGLLPRAQRSPFSHALVRKKDRTRGWSCVVLTCGYSARRCFAIVPHAESGVLSFWPPRLGGSLRTLCIFRHYDLLDRRCAFLRIVLAYLMCLNPWHVRPLNRQFRYENGYASPFIYTACNYPCVSSVIATFAAGKEKDSWRGSAGARKR